MVANLLNRHLTVLITFHDVIHGFWAGRGMGTANFETKLLQNITAMREAVLFKVFLELQKAYDTLYRDIFLNILAAYWVGLRALRLHQMY